MAVIRKHYGNEHYVSNHNVNERNILDKYFLNCHKDKNLPEGYCMKKIRDCYTCDFYKNIKS